MFDVHVQEFLARSVISQQCPLGLIMFDPQFSQLWNGDKKLISVTLESKLNEARKTVL